MISHGSLKIKDVLLPLMMVALLSVCATASAQSTSPAGPLPLTVSMVGGSYEQLVADSIDKPLEDTKQLSITVDTESHPERLTKLVTERGHPGSFDVVQFPDYFMYQANAYGLLQKIDVSRMATWKTINPAFRRSYSIPHIYSAAVILYDPAHVKPAPTSYSVFWDPRYKGHIGALDFMFPQWLWLASTQAGTRKGHDFDAGWPKLRALKDNGLQVFPTQESLDSAIKSGQIWLTLNYRARAVQLVKAGVAIENVVPKEGAWPVSFEFAIPKNAQHVRAAYIYLNQVLTKAAQQAASDRIFYAPVVSTVKATGALARSIDFTRDEIKRFLKVDFAYVSTNSPRWQQRWEEQIK